MPVSPARAAAFDILLRAERESSFASELLHAATYQRLSTSDHALTTELVMGVLRWRSRLDQEIATAAAQPLARLDLEILVALRLALYQFRWLDRIPQRAALHESVELVKRARKRSAAPFVNAVLRKIAAAQQDRTEFENESTPEDLARALAHPLWLVERWASEYGIAAARRICEHDQSIPTTAIRVRGPIAERDSSELMKAGVMLNPGALLASARRVAAGDITKAHAFHTGQIVIQDEASQLVAALVGYGLKNETRILDCCAAPGGKTLAIADHNWHATITAVEIHPHRARLVERRLQTLLSSARIQTVIADARHLPLSVKFERILADVPCSGTGTLARNPEIKWRLQPNDLSQLQARQSAILRSALAQVGAGGRIIYSTCSLEKEENEDVVEQVLANDKSIHHLNCCTELDRLKTAGDLTWPDPASLTRGPYLRTIPGIHPCDGFFAAILERT
ncbi:MAG TPA: 16S rRNA (cytosine(967)-C(5))-methyltransferase RsmB [Candidatus Sulfotelmatobacter sp.]|nr:16S rRNA (cytosine(967)-C(5))-methyltransferase RsmB [Candidatus Sulfotelmatobacter sp.]